MAEAIRNKFKIDSELKKSSGGVFEVTAGEELIFSKKSSGRFPNEQEVLDQIAALKSGNES